MPRKKKVVEESLSLLDITAKLRSGPCVPALREAVKAWKAADCKGITDTTRTLLNFWFHADHKLKTGINELREKLTDVGRHVRVSLFPT